MENGGSFQSQAGLPRGERILALVPPDRDLRVQAPGTLVRDGDTDMYTLRLLGGASIEGPDGPLAGAVAQRQRIALLAYLALSVTGRVSRDKLLAVFWPETDPEKARHALSNALYILKKELGEEALFTIGEELGLNLDRISVDAVEFLAASEAGDAQGAVSLYRGPFLDGIHLRDAPDFEHWVDEERRRLARTYGEVLEALAKRQAEAGDHRNAVQAWRKLAALDPFNAQVAKELMAALDAAGRRAEAIQHAGIYSALVRGELEAEPDPSVAEMADRLRAAPSAAREADVASGEAPASSVSADSADLISPPSASTVAPSRLQAPVGTPQAQPRDGGAGLARLHEHRFFQWCLTYLAGAWFILQLMEALSDPLGFSTDFQRGVVTILVLGFPVALVVAWYRGQRRHPTVQGSAFLVAIVVLGTLGTILAVLKSPAVEGPAGTTPGSVLRGSMEERTHPRPLPSVAVLPFDNIGPDPSDAYLADGIHEELLTQLSKISGLIVISRSSVMTFRDRDLPGPEIARELNVSAIVEGSVQKSGEEIRITAQLIHGKTDAHLWGERYDRRLSVENLFQVQTEIALRIAENLRATLTPAEKARLARLPTADLEAFDLYLRGKQAYLRYQAEDNARAIDLFNQAVARDPGFAMAWAGLGNAYGQGVLVFGLTPDWADSAIVVSRRAIDLDPEGAEGHKALGLGLTSKARYRPALEAFMEALRVDPNHPSATANVGVMLMRFGALDESLLWTRRTLEVAPNHMLARANLAWNYLSLEEWNLAEEWANETASLAPEILHAREASAFLASARGDLAEGLRIAEEILQSDPEAPARRQFAAEMALLARNWGRVARYSQGALDLTPGGAIPPWHLPQTTLGYALIQQGEAEEGLRYLASGREALTTIMETGSDDPRLAWEMGCALAAEGAKEDALAWLERGYDEGWRWAKVTEMDPLFDSLRGEPGFRDLMAELRQEVEAMRRRAREDEEAAGLRRVLPG